MIRNQPRLPLLCQPPFTRSGFTHAFKDGTSRYPLRNLRRLALGLAVLLLTGCLGLPKADALLYGTWRSGETDTIMMTFAPDNTFTLASADEEGDTLTGRYRFDMSVQPFHLDLDLGDMGQISTIIEFVDSDTIRIEDTSAGEPRPTSFGGQEILFTRDSPPATAALSDRTVDDGTAQQDGAMTDRAGTNHAGTNRGVTNRAGAVRDLLRFTPDTPENRRYLTYGDYTAWLDAWDIDRPANFDDLDSMPESAWRRWVHIMPRQTTPPNALGLQYIATASMAERFGFDFFGSDRFLEAGSPPDVLTVMTHRVDAAMLDRALTAAGYAVDARNDGSTLYSRGEDNGIDFEAPSAFGRMGELNRIARQDGTLIIGRNTGVVDDALAAAAAEAPALLDMPAYQGLLASLDARELADLGALVGIIILGEPVLADVAAQLFSGNSSDEIMAELGAMLEQEPPLPLYLVTGFATYRASDATYLALHAVFPDADTAAQGAEILADRMQGYVSVMHAMPIPWTLEKSFSTDEIAVIVMRLDEVEQEGMRQFAWLEMILTRDMLFLLAE